MKSLLNCLAALLFCLISVNHACAQNDWTGRWQTHWSEGGGQITLEQQGDQVAGNYPLYGVRLEATADGRSLSGKWSEGDEPAAARGEFIITRSKDGRTFVGRFSTRGWWTGERIGQSETLAAISLRSPRDAFVGFIVACNQAQAGLEDAWGIAADAVEFAPAAEPPTDSTDNPLSQAQRLLRVAELFALIDLTTIRAWDIPNTLATDSYVLRLTQSGSDASLELTLHKNAQGDWRIVEPTAQQLADAEKSLRARDNGKVRTGNDYARLQNPRATMRAFLEGMTHWNEDNGALARSTMDLSVFSEIIRQTDSELSALFVRHALDNIGLIGLQSISDDGSDHTPYVHFVDGVGSIVIAPASSAADAPWQFTGDTVIKAPLLYRASTGLPNPEFTPPGSVAETAYFKLRGLFVDYAPYLLWGAGHGEAWQVILALSALGLSIILARFVSGLVCRLLSRVDPADERTKDQPRWFRFALTMLLAVSVMAQIPQVLGIPANLRQHTIPVIGSVLCIAGVFVAWRMLSLLGVFLAGRAARTAARTDDILLTFTIAVLRLGIVLAGFLGIATVLSISATNILAGLGIGGLAFAFASRETLSNVFGAGILITDRPFRSGDWIETGDVEGSVEEVGIRSTRVRTVADSVVVVPNGKLADSTINNLGTRRHRLLNLTVFVTEGGTPERLQSFIEAVRTRIESDPAFAREEAKVGVIGLSATAIEIQLSAYMNLPSDRAESDTRHALLTDLMRAAELSGLTLGKGMQRGIY